jgi:hypothetical protein
MVGLYSHYSNHAALVWHGTVGVDGGSGFLIKSASSSSSSAVSQSQIAALRQALFDSFGAYHTPSKRSIRVALHRLEQQFFVSFKRKEHMRTARGDSIAIAISDHSFLFSSSHLLFCSNDLGQWH